MKTRKDCIQYVTYCIQNFQDCLYFIIVKKQAEKLSLYLTGSFFQHKKYPDVLDLNEFNVIQESPYFGKSSCSFTIRGEYYALGNCPESDSDPEKCFRLWKIGSTKVEPTQVEFNRYMDSEIFGWKCTSQDDRGHLLLVENDGTPFATYMMFDGLEIYGRLGWLNAGIAIALL